MRDKLQPARWQANYHSQRSTIRIWRVLTSIPFKGQLLNQMTNFWFEKTKKQSPTHPRQAGPKCDCVQEAKPCRWNVIRATSRECLRAYREKRGCSESYSPRDEKNQQLPQARDHPSTKATTGHDEAISKEIISKKCRAEGNLCSYGGIHLQTLRGRV